ncbi:helix-turn-helix domain-containing protein [Brevibacillus panacihumi]|uniref:helix-turn-helix domain-containing protein n=1 Tax=Brevibacillus panacihumi TaxID=497735 RepID=UPI003D08CA67
MSAEQNLVSVETQSEYSVTTGRRETRIFVKMYVDAVHSGLLADIGDENWRTLCVIAAFMDERGEAVVTQDVIAETLGVTRCSANRRVRKLMEYRWNEQPVITKRADRCPVTGTFETLKYVLLPIKAYEGGS